MALGTSSAQADLLPSNSLVGMVTTLLTVIQERSSFVGTPQLKQDLSQLPRATLLAWRLDGLAFLDFDSRNTLNISSESLLQLRGERAGHRSAGDLTRPLV